MQMALAAAPFVSAGMSVVSAAGQISAGRTQQRMYNAQAEQARIQGRSQAIAYKQQGAAVLRNLNETLASTIALAGAGNVDPTSGSARVMQEFARAEAYAEYGTALDNAVLAKEGAAAQAQVYRMAGRAAFQTGIINAAGALGEGIQRSLTLQPGATAAP
jgi:hypothetical protein